MNPQQISKIRSLLTRTQQKAKSITFRFQNINIKLDENTKIVDLEPYFHMKYPIAQVFLSTHNNPQPLTLKMPFRTPQPTDTKEEALLKKTLLDLYEARLELALRKELAKYFTKVDEKIQQIIKVTSEAVVAKIRSDFPDDRF